MPLVLTYRNGKYYLNRRLIPEPEKMFTPEAMKKAREATAASRSKKKQ